MNGILEIPHHHVSMETKPQHQYCPVGEKSWCGWQRDKVNNTNDYTHHDELSEYVFDCILPVFTGLSNEDLLRKCLHGGTQNRNESFHNVLWGVTPRVHYQKCQTFEASVHMAILLWNSGARIIASLLNELGIEPREHTMQFTEDDDQMHLYKVREKQCDSPKQRHVLLRSMNKTFYDKSTLKIYPTLGGRSYTLQGQLSK